MLRYLLRLRKRKYPKIPAKPGTIIDLVDDEGALRARLVLEEIVSDYRQGTSARFVELSKYMEKTIAW